ncbi:hypothetical protein TRAPUB_8757 [Trametes pubescens]|uniref:Uncharacterized protein n=1 Tax=Trametes pubescens TaxID=154538 RepID=A0A1M2W4B9_TRAPU|nr:hypothetical protein TRAPUB_8757 [Trametes pubescens]
MLGGTSHIGAWTRCGSDAPSSKPQRLNGPLDEDVTENNFVDYVKNVDGGGREPEEFRDPRP